MSEIPLETLLEATLFSAGRSLGLEELSQNLGYEEEEITESLANSKALSKEGGVADCRLFRSERSGLWK